MKASGTSNSSATSNASSRSSNGTRTSPTIGVISNPVPVM